MIPAAGLLGCGAAIWEWQLQPPAADISSASQTKCWIYSDPAWLPTDYCAKQPYSLIRQVSDDSLRWKEQGERAEGEKQRFQEKSGEVFFESLNSLEFRVWGNRTDGQKYKRFRQLIRPGAVSPAHNLAQLFVFLREWPCAIVHWLCVCRQCDVKAIFMKVCIKNSCGSHSNQI